MESPPGEDNGVLSVGDSAGIAVKKKQLVTIQTYKDIYTVLGLWVQHPN